MSKMDDAEKFEDRIEEEQLNGDEVIEDAFPTSVNDQVTD